MIAKFCNEAGRPGCYEVAIKAARSDAHCRPHYVEDVLSKAELLRCEVVGPCEVTDARTNKGVGKGGTVELDPAETNVAALVAAGHVKVIPAAKAETKAKTEKA